MMLVISIFTSSELPQEGKEGKEEKCKKRDI